MMKKTKKILALMAMALITQSCYYDNKEDLYQNIGNNDCDTTTVTYSGTIEAIITTNCAVSGCHVSPNAQSNLDLSQFADVQSIALNDELVGRITGTPGPLMPPGQKLPPCDIQKIQKWVADGAPNN